MSNVNIKRAVENIKHGTSVYTPLVEVIVNSIQAIDEAKEENGIIHIYIERSAQGDMEGLPDVTGFRIQDNGIGFDEKNRTSFDTLYTDNKMDIGGKGFGRFTYLKYFDEVTVHSTYKNAEAFMARRFKMGKNTEIITDETNGHTKKTKTGSEVHLRGIKAGKFQEKKVVTIGKILVERLLPYFITKDYKCPQIAISESDGKDEIQLNGFVENPKFKNITEMVIDNGNFRLGENDNKYDFEVRLFKFYAPKSQKSKVSLVAHKREASETAIHNYVPEFAEEFFETSGEQDTEKNYIIKAYVFGKYLDDNVSLERGAFNFPKEANMFFSIGQEQIESAASAIAAEAMGTDVKARQERKLERIKDYVEAEAPWHRKLLESADLSGIPMHPTKSDIEERLQRIKFNKELETRKEVKEILEGITVDDLATKIPEIVGRITDTSQNDLIHYIAMRRSVIDLFKKSLELTESGAYRTEGDVHDIIFPRKGDTDKTKFEEHNLWILDERLNFTTFVSSDQPLNGPNSDRTDLLVYNRRVLFRGENDPSNPVTIFEFKRPQREDFTNPSSDEDPIAQIVRYTNAIRGGKYKTPQGRSIAVSDTTPFFGYVVLDLTQKVADWLHKEKNFKPMPDGLGWFQWNENINLYIEVLGWDKIIKDAEMRNKIFFHKLNIQ